MSKTTKILGSLLNTVINHIGDGIKNVIDNTEITEELSQNGEDGKKTYSVHFNIGKKKLNVIDVEVEQIDFYIKNGVLLSYQGHDNHITIPNNVTEIGENAFKNKNIHSVTIPDSVSVIGENAFCDCVELEKVIFGQNVKEISKSAFENCYMLQSAELPENHETLGDRCFAENWNLHHVVLPNHIEFLPDELFMGCQSLEHIKWPDHLKQWGKNIFSDCFEPDLWQYFVVEDGECQRISNDQNELDPDNVLGLDVSYYSMTQSRKLLNWIWKDFPFDKDIVQYRMEFCKKALYFCAIFSDCEIYATLQTINLCYEILNSTPESINQPTFWIEFMHRILNTIAGNGESWKKSDNDIKDSILCEEDLNDPIVHDIAQKAFISLMAELYIPLTINRYHPGIYHYAAEYKTGQGYWDFALKLEGLLRSENYNITACLPECVPDDSLEEWLCTWSKLPELVDTAIIMLSLYDDEHCDKIWFSIMSRERAESLRQFLDELHCADNLDGWINGEKLFALRLI